MKTALIFFVTFVVGFCIGKISAAIRRLNEAIKRIDDATHPIDRVIDRTHRREVAELPRKLVIKKSCKHCGSPFGQAGEVPVCHLPMGIRRCELSWTDLQEALYEGAASPNAVRDHLNEKEADLG